MNKQMSTVVVAALAALAGAGQFETQLSRNVYTMAGHTVLVQAHSLTVISATGNRRTVGL